MRGSVSQGLCFTNLGGVRVGARAFSNAQANEMTVSVVGRDLLYVSEPNPRMFGNGPNETNNPHWTNKNWLKSRFHFNFAEHTGGKNNFGVLRVMNDDLVQPNKGFGRHPHSNMEIVTYVVEGELTHKDSMGTAETLGRGAIQFMMWILPSKSGLEPKYGSARASAPEERINKWDHLVAPVQSQVNAKAEINQDVNIYVSELVGKSEKIHFPLSKSRQAYVLAVEGDVKIGQSDGKTTEKLLRQQDAAEIVHDGLEEQTFFFSAESDRAHVLVVEMAAK